MSTKTVSPMTGFSPAVTISLLIDGRKVEVSEVGPTFLVLAEPYSCPPCEATLRVTVGDEIELSRIYLCEGLQPGRFKQPVADVE
jgi:hypothetical protein